VRQAIEIGLDALSSPSASGLDELDLRRRETIAKLKKVKEEETRESALIPNPNPNSNPNSNPNPNPNPNSNWRRKKRRDANRLGRTALRLKIRGYGLNLLESERA